MFFVPFQSDKTTYEINSLFPLEKTLGPFVQYLCHLSPFPSALKCIFWKLGVIFLNKIIHPILTVHGNITWRYVTSGVTSLKKWKNLPFSSSLVFRLSFSFSEVTGGILPPGKPSYWSLCVSTDAPFYCLALTFPTASWTVLFWFTELGTYR